MVKNIIIEKNVSRYDLIVGEYSDHHYNKETFFFIWLIRGNCGPTFSWRKGDRFDARYATSKCDGINQADMVGIVSGLKELFPGCVGDIVCDDIYQQYL